MLLELLLLLAAVALFCYRHAKVPTGMPPGSLGWPVVGAMPPRDRHITQYFKELRDKYGTLFTTKWGSYVILVLSDLRIVRAAFSHPEFQGRMHVNSIHLLNHHNQNTGVIGSEGHVWLENRRFMLRHLQDLGMGKTMLETSIQIEAAMLVAYFEKQDLENAVAMNWGINVSVLNVIWMMLASIRYEAEDKAVREMTTMFDEDLTILQGPMFLLDFMPWLITVTPTFLSNRIFRCNVVEANRKLFRDMAWNIIEDHRDALDRNNPLDIIDYYLVEMNKQKNNSGTTFKADYSDLVTTMGDMFLAGSETTSSTLRWMLLFMACYPKTQRNVQAELEKVVAKDQLPSLDGRPQLAYIDAMILDVLRLSSLTPKGAFHRAMSDVQFEGYIIPKDTILIATLEIYHRDPKLWEKPDELYPEHFLDSQGTLDAKKEAFMPFSVGRRQCLGESLARMELFRFTSAILHRFEVSPPPGVTLDLGTDPTKYIFNQPKPFKVMLKKRS